MKETHEPTRYHLILFQKDKDQIDRGLVRKIQSFLDEKVTTPPNETEIDIWIESLGGDAHAAYKLILELRSRCQKLQAVIPDFAKSAATLLVLGVDKVFMSPAAELGPLDVQIMHPDREGYIVSGLDIADSFQFLIKTAIELVIMGGASLLQYTGLTRQAVLHEALHFTADFLQPTVTKLDTHLVHQATQELRVAQDYGVKLLRNRNVSKDEALNENEIDNLMQTLITTYPTHGFVISRDDARSFKLPVENAENYVRWKEVKGLYEAFAESDDSCILVIEDSGLDRLRSDSENQEQLEKENINDSDSQKASQNQASSKDGKGKTDESTKVVER